MATDKDGLPKVSAIILTFNRPVNDVLECLKSVNSTKYPNLEIILVDNSTKSPSEFATLELNNTKLIDITGKENLGASGGRNIGVRFSTGKYLFFVDDDVIIHKDSIFNLVKIIEKDSSIGIIGPMMYRYDEPSEKWFYEQYINDASKDIVDVPMIVGGALLTSRNVLQKIGLFDTFYFFYHEDWDICFRAQLSGYRTVCTVKDSSWHKVPKNEYDKLFVKTRAYYWHRNFFIFAGRNLKTTKQALNFLLLSFIFSGKGIFPILYLPSALKKQKYDSIKSYFKGIFDGLADYLKLKVYPNKQTRNESVQI